MTTHVVLFVVIGWISAVVYHALRAEDVLHAVLAGTRRFASFLVLAAAFGAALYGFTRWL